MKKKNEKTAPPKLERESKTERFRRLQRTKTPPGSQDMWDYYRRQGFSVFPVKPNKKPAVKTWKCFQTRHATDGEVASWKKAGYGIAIVTGKLSNLIVFDADTPEAIAELLALAGPGFKCPMVRTPSGGLHFYVRYDPLVPQNVEGLGKSGKIDVRSEGGYVVAPSTRAKYEKPERSGNWIEGIYRWRDN